MPVQTSVITGTVAHKHSATGGSSDGGQLATGGAGGDTSFDLASGSVLYSNGTSLEELTVGSNGSSMTVSGGLPAWGGAGASTYEKLTSVAVGTPSTTLDATFSAITGDDIAGLYMVFKGQWNTGNLKIKFNGTSSTGHSTNGLRMEGNGNLYGYYESDTNGFLLCPSVTTAGSKGTFQIFANLMPSGLSGLSSFNCQWSGNGKNVESWIGSGFLSDTSISEITEVNLFKTSGNMSQYSTLDIYKINV